MIHPLRRALLVGLLAVPISGCDTEDPVAPPDPVKIQATIDAFGLAPLPMQIYPQYNPYSGARIALGRLLFFDPILSGEAAPWIKRAAGRDPYRYRASDVACATCHHPDFAFSDGRRLASGPGSGSEDGMALGPARAITGTSSFGGAEIPPMARNSPTVLNAAYNGLESPEPTAESYQFMDGRVTLGLEIQAIFPVTVREEMAGDAYGRHLLGDALSIDAVRDSVTLRIRAIPGYESLFIAAYPEEIASSADIQLNHISKALAAYERELITPGSRYDRFLEGNHEILDARERAGFDLFFGKAQCGECHLGPMLSDFTFHVQGVADAYESVLPGFGGKDGQGRDFGRFHADPTEFADRKYAFRTMSLRNIDLTPPYFHSGSAATLREVVEFYDRGGRGPGSLSEAELAAAGAVLDEDIRPLNLTPGEIDAVVAFMKTTTGEVPPGPGGLDLTEPPQRVPSGLLPPGIPTPDGDGPFLPQNTEAADAAGGRLNR